MSPQYWTSLSSNLPRLPLIDPTQQQSPKIDTFNGKHSVSTSLINNQNITNHTNTNLNTTTLNTNNNNTFNTSINPSITTLNTNINTNINVNTNTNANIIESQVNAANSQNFVQRTGQEVKIRMNITTTTLQAYR